MLANVGRMPNTGGSHLPDVGKCGSARREAFRLGGMQTLFIPQRRGIFTGAKSSGAAVHAEPVRQLAIVLRVKDRDVGVFAGLEAAFAILQVECARAVDRS